MKLYKNTLISSVIVFIICVLLSIVFEFTCLSKLSFFSFLSDYMIGVSCSIIVVIITTFLQFKYEQKKSLDSILYGIKFFLFRYTLIAISLDPREETSKSLWEYYYDEVYKETKKFSLQLSNIEWISKKNSQIAFDLRKAFLNIMVDLAKGSNENKKELLTNTIHSHWIEEIKNNALLLAASDEQVAKEIADNYEKIKLELANCNNENI